MATDEQVISEEIKHAREFCMANLRLSCLSTHDRWALYELLAKYLSENRMRGGA